VRAAHVRPRDGIRKIGHAAQLSVGGGLRGEGAARGLTSGLLGNAWDPVRRGRGYVEEREKDDRWGMSRDF